MLLLLIISVVNGYVFDVIHSCDSVLRRSQGIVLANLVFCVGVAMQTGAKGLPLFVSFFCFDSVYLIHCPFR